MPVINIANAELKTASIEIKSLTVNGKQLTLSTFRQIPSEELINIETMTFNGIPWGSVNYFWKDNGDEHSHWNIIWQKGTELRRNVIYKDYTNHYWYRGSKSKIGELEKWLRVYTDIKHESGFMVGYNYTEYTDNNFIYLQDQIKYYSEQKDSNNNLSTWALEKITKLKESYERVKNDYEEESESFGSMKLSFANNLPKFKSLFDSLKDLPQLFIAI